jgi:hypothetical protein
MLSCPIVRTHRTCGADGVSVWHATAEFDCGKVLSTPPTTSETQALIDVQARLAGRPIAPPWEEHIGPLWRALQRVTGCVQMLVGAFADEQDVIHSRGGATSTRGALCNSVRRLMVQIDAAVDAIQQAHETYLKLSSDERAGALRACSLWGNVPIHLRDATAEVAAVAALIGRPDLVRAEKRSRETITFCFSLSPARLDNYDAVQAWAAVQAAEWVGDADARLSHIEKSEREVLAWAAKDSTRALRT